jgi:hypothetical protein
MVVTLAVPDANEGSGVVVLELYLSIGAQVAAAGAIAAGMTATADGSGYAVLGGAGDVNSLGIAESTFDNTLGADPTPDMYNFIRFGLCRVIADNAITGGNYIGPGATGYVTDLGDDPSGITVPILGRALDTAGAKDDVIRAWIGVI